MRISNYLKNLFKDAIYKSFGECEIILFGSRVDDNKKGGDFDIAIDLLKSEIDKKGVKL